MIKLENVTKTIGEKVILETFWSRVSCLVSLSLSEVSNCLELCIVTANGCLVYFAFKIYVVII